MNSGWIDIEIVSEANVNGTVSWNLGRGLDQIRLDRGSRNITFHFRPSVEEPNIVFEFVLVSPTNVISLGETKIM